MKPQIKLTYETYNNKAFTKTVFFDTREKAEAAAEKLRKLKQVSNVKGTP